VYSTVHKKWKSKRNSKLEFIEENGLPHQRAHWFAMTVVIDTFCTKFSAASYQTFMSLRGGLKGRRGNPHPYKLQFEPHDKENHPDSSGRLQDI